MKKTKKTIQNPFFNPEAFSNFIFKILIEKGLQDSHSDVYKRAGLSRATFSNFLCGTSCPNARNARKLAIGLKCTVIEAQELLSYCGFCFNPHSAYDQCLLKCLENQNFDYFKVDLFIHKKIGFSWSESQSAA